MLIPSLVVLIPWGCAGDDSLDVPSPSGTKTIPVTETATPTGETGTVAPPPPPSLGDWTWANPLPQGSPIDRVRWVTDTTAFALTNGGGVLRTTDAGNTWHTLYALQGLGYGDHGAMSFLDDQQGWLVGRQGRVVRTQDGGESWTDLSLKDFPYTLHDVTFTNPQHGVAVGTTGRLITTDDGGETWVERSHPGGSTFLNAVAFADDLHGWVGGDDGLVLETTDGGTKWTLLNPPFSEDIEQAVVAGDGVAMATRTEVHVWNGSGWLQEASVDTVLDLQFESEGDGLVLYADEGELRLGTLTGGQLTFEPLALTPSARTLTKRGERILIGGWWGALYTSSDGGATYQNAWSQLLTYDATQFLDVAMAGLRGITAGFNGIALWTDDGGVTWTEAATGTTTDLRAVWIEDDGTAVAAGYDNARVPTILYSADSGETWSTATLPPSLTQAVLNGVALWDDGRGIAVGWIPEVPVIELVLISEDRGQSWTPVTTPGETAGFIDVWAHGTDQAWVGAGFGDLARTTDGGQSFAMVETDSSRAFHRVQFADALSGWAATKSQDVLRTTDGGLTWETTVVPGTSFDDIHFGSPLVGLAVDGNGPMYGTIDGGQTWTPQASQWSGFGIVRAVAMTSETDAVIVGTELKIAYTRSAGGLLEP
ncbi:MAG: YCF48-related protein [Myxococcota bacterium]